MTQVLSVGVVFRNYIPLHTPYASFLSFPPTGITFDIPKARSYLKTLYPIYQRFGNNALVAQAVKLAQKILFQPKQESISHHDVLFLIGMLPPPDVKVPYVIDLEHIYSMLNFTKLAESARSDILQAFTNPLCKAITPLSLAANRTVKEYLGDDYSKIESKVQVIYPAIPHYRSSYANEIDYSIIPKNPDFTNFLFVGKESYGKGLPELLEAFHVVSQSHPNARLTVVSNTPQTLISKYRHPSIRFLKPRFTYSEVIRKLFLPSDIFVMPTHSDTFGMVYLDALSSGLPVISTKQFAIPEMVSHGENGLLLDHPPLFLDIAGLPTRRAGKDLKVSDEVERAIIESLIANMSYMLNSPDAVLKMRANASKEFEPQGKFSIAKRNALLTKVFSGSL
jgi:glycosyltransferase involved in cell wall biosynthesis